MVVIYQAKNKINGKLYVGVTKKSLQARRSGHLTSARAGSMRPFQCAIRKYGIDNFEFSVLEECGEDYKAGLTAEKSWVKKLEPEYNATRGGEGALGYKHTPEALEKMRLAKIGKPGPWRGKKRPDLAGPARERMTGSRGYWSGKIRYHYYNDRAGNTQWL